VKKESQGIPGKKGQTEDTEAQGEDSQKRRIARKGQEGQKSQGKRERAGLRQFP